MKLPCSILHQKENCWIRNLVDKYNTCPSFKKRVWHLAEDRG